MPLTACTCPPSWLASATEEKIGEFGYGINLEEEIMTRPAIPNNATPCILTNT